MLFLNPSGFTVELNAPNQIYIFEPFSELDVWESDHIRLFVKEKAVELGIVPINYNKANQSLYPTYEDYKRAKKLEGLKKLLAFKKNAWINERQAEVDVTQGKNGRAGAEADKAVINPDRFKKDVELVESWIAALTIEEFKEGKSENPHLSKEYKEELQKQMKQRGRSREGLGSSDHQNEGAAQAG